jgi:hypothetical protein
MTCEEKRLVRRLVAASDAHDELADAYRKYGWDLSATDAESVARGLRERAKDVGKEKEPKS